MKITRWTTLFLLLAAVAYSKVNAKTEKELMAAMDLLKDATINRDVAAFTKLAHPEITYCHSSGLTQDKKVLLEYVPTMNTGSIVYLDNSIRVYGNLAIVKNVTDIRGREATTPFLINAMYVWVKGAEGWQLIARQVIRMPNPNAPARGGN